MRTVFMFDFFSDKCLNHPIRVESNVRPATRTIMFDVVGQNDPWKIKKRLTKSDINHLSRLLLSTELVQLHILSYLPEDDVRKVHEKAGLDVEVFDYDTGTTHSLVLKRWETSRSYVINGGWSTDFVRRRNLTTEDEIGLFWDQLASKLCFRVLPRDPAIAQNPN